MKKTFLLGVGAQKSGTTWLYNSLVKYADEFQPGFCKEYHIFDGLSTNPLKIDLVKKNILSYLDQPKCLSNNGMGRNFLYLASFYDDVENYLDYFENLLYKNPNKTLVADITPSYSSLNLEHLKKIKNLLESRGFIVKCIFIAREPLDRAWSAARYYFSRRYELYNEESDSQMHLEYLKLNYNKQKFLMRGMYNETIYNCNLVFRDDFKCFFFENLFTTETILQLKTFLGLSEFSPVLNFKINANLKIENASPYEFIPTEFIQSFIDRYKDVYFFMEKNYRIKTSKYWPHYKHFLNH